jgi:hypothetical protein
VLLYRQNKTGRTAARNKTTRAGQPGEDTKKRRARKGQLEQDRQDKTAMTGPPGHCSWDRAARIGLPE